MQCLEQQQDLPAADHGMVTMPNLRMHACIVECVPCKLLLPSIAHCRLSLYNSSRPYTRDSLIQTKAGGAAPAPHRISKVRANSVLSSLNSRCSSHHCCNNEKSHRNWSFANLLAHKQVGMVLRWTVKFL
uniref:Uncharacterized protein n=1 Tax=Dunaliella tertiolecta TaxID=3047 RepID=A0A7S3QPM1_DUNTE